MPFGKADVLTVTLLLLSTVAEHTHSVPLFDSGLKDYLAQEFASDREGLFLGFFIVQLGCKDILFSEAHKPTVLVLELYKLGIVRRTPTLSRSSA